MLFLIVRIGMLRGLCKAAGDVVDDIQILFDVPSLEKVISRAFKSFAIAKASNPVLMAGAMKKAVEAGREAFLAGRMPRKIYQATPSSPMGGLIGGK